MRLQNEIFCSLTILLGACSTCWAQQQTAPESELDQSITTSEDFYANGDFHQALKVGEKTLDSLAKSISAQDEIKLRQRLVSYAYKALEIEKAKHHASASHELCSATEISDSTRMEAYWQLEFARGVSKATHSEVAQMVNLEVEGFKDYRKSKFARAEQQFRQLAELETKYLGKNHPYLAYSLELIADCCAKLGRYNDAIIAMKQSYEINKISSTYRPGAAGKNAFDLGGYYQEVKQLELAHDCFVNAYSWHQKANDRLACANATTKLVHACVALDRTDDAIECLYIASKAYCALGEIKKESRLWQQFPENAGIRELERANQFLVERSQLHQSKNEIDKSLLDQMFRFVITSRLQESNYESQLDALKQIVRLATQIGSWKVISTFQDKVFPNGIEHTVWDRTIRHLLCDLRFAKQLSNESSEFKTDYLRVVNLLDVANQEPDLKKSIPMYMDATQQLGSLIGTDHEVYSNHAVELAERLGKSGMHLEAKEWFYTAYKVRHQLKGRFPGATEAKLSWIHAMADSGEVENAIREMEEFRSTFGFAGFLYDKTLIGVLRSEISLKEKFESDESALGRAHVVLNFQRKKEANPDSIIETEMICSQLHFKIQEQKAALGHAEKAIQLATDNSDLKSLSQIYVDTADRLTTAGKKQLAAEFIRKAESANRQLEESSFLDRQRSKLARLETELSYTK